MLKLGKLQKLKHLQLKNKQTALRIRKRGHNAPFSFAQLWTTSPT